jgi:hypothetical protein
MSIAVIDKDTVVFNAVYVPKIYMEDDVFAYVRFLKNGEIGFSVLDDLTNRPDFSNCGVFWQRPEDFLAFFKLLEIPDLSSPSYTGN